MLWFQVEKDWQRLVQIANLMILAAALDLILISVHWQDVTHGNFALWLYVGHLVLFGLAALVMHALLYRSITSFAPG